MKVVKKIVDGAGALKRLIGNKEWQNAYNKQQRTLKKLLTKAEKTDFGKEYDFHEIINADEPAKLFQKRIPPFDYDSIFKQYWHRTLQDEENICWPGKTKYFALSSGTSEDTSKRIPVTTDMLHSMRRTSFRQFKALLKCDLQKNFYKKDVLMVGGSIDLSKSGGHYEGDLSGILMGHLPYWLQPFRKPGKSIAMERDWNKKLEAITLKAKDWDIAVIAGVPSWVQIVMENVINHYQVQNIHDIWPNLQVFIHGGVSFEPYRNSFQKLLAKDIIYLETYLASEGFLAFQNGPDRNMQLAINGQIFFEFVPFNEENFTPEGQIKPDAKALLLDEVETGRDYALLISTCAGAWRYLIGDTIRFTSLDNYEMVISGRTKHYLSLCGEHLSVDNMNQALKKVSEELHISVPEYTVTGISHDNLFAHKWYIGTDDPVDETTLKNLLDQYLKEVNDDYAIERNHALKEVFVEIIPLSEFYGFLDKKGKSGGQHKFPRVLKGNLLREWEAFLEA